MAITAAQAIKAIKGSQGFVTTIAKRLGCTRGNVYALLKKYSTVKEALEDERDAMKDFAEAQLFKNIKDGKETSLIFYLKTQAKDRGYIEKQQLQVDWRQSLPDGYDPDEVQRQFVEMMRQAQSANSDD